MERISGRKANRQKSGSYTHKKAKSFRQTPKSRISPQTRAGIARIAELAELNKEISDMLDNPSKYYDQSEAEKVVYRRHELALKLRADGIDVPEHYMEKP